MDASLVIVQLSPNNVDWITDGDVQTLHKETMTILTSNKFLRYIRLGYKSNLADAPATLTAIFQAQG